ncbi:MAG: 4-hydroxy-tetrahydrodipicolinate synthase [Bdellovibrio sp.]|nr:4-hydroxy-tetrahydrodipicolinate synthase [Bdellovibrio sp.]
MKHNFKGVISALVTPFDQGKIDLKSLENIVQYQLKNGVDGFVANATTSESPTLSWEEVEQTYHCVRKITKDNVPVIIGTGSNSTEQTVDMSKKASQLGADAVLVVVPYYNKPPQKGIVQHFKKVAEASTAPVFLYNVPGRTVVSLSVESIAELSAEKNIVGIKEASGDMSYDLDMVQKTSADFIKLSGDDGTYIPFLKMGGHGVISVMSNIIPAVCATWTKLAADQKWTEAETDFKKYDKFINDLFVEANPIVPKWMLYKMGLIKSAEMRLPLTELDIKFHNSILSLMKEFSLV